MHMETEFPTLTALTTEITSRRAFKPDVVVLPADDPKSRRVGFVVGSQTATLAEEDEYLFVRMKNLTSAEMSTLTGFVSQTEPDLAGLWDAGIMNDVMDKAEELSDGERGAAVDQAKLPSTKQMAAWCDIVQEGITQAGLDWTAHSPGGSPFTFRWGTGGGWKEHHGRVEVCTDHLGVTFCVGEKDGLFWGNIFDETRLTWSSTGITPARVATHVEAIYNRFKDIPQCQCEDHIDRRAGINKYK